MSRNVLLYTIFIVFILPTLYGQSREIHEINLGGTYQGKNLYVQNPLKSDKSCFCTQQVFVNDVIVSENPQTSAFEINLSFLNPGENLSIKILHDNSCLPKIINPQVIRGNNPFLFLTITADENSIRWYTQGEEEQGRFVLEKMMGNAWLPVNEQNANGSRAYNQYELNTGYLEGRNDFRIKYMPLNGSIYYSKVFGYTLNNITTLIKTTIEPEKIMLSRTTDYEVLDSAGNTLFKGHGTEIELNHLKKGLYYLNVENRVEKFHIK